MNRVGFLKFEHGSLFLQNGQEISILNMLSEYEDTVELASAMKDLLLAEDGGKWAV